MTETAQIEPLLKFIRKLESGDNYDRVWARIKKSDYPPKPITQMTVAEVLAWQDRIDPKYMSEASGAYQHLEDTLRTQVANKVVAPSAKFNKAIQDILAMDLMRGRGLGLYLSGKISAETFANNLAKEWASLPVVSGPRKGRSYYDKDAAGNVALTKVADFMAAIHAIKGGVTVEWDMQVKPAPVSLDKPAFNRGVAAATGKSFWAEFFAAIGKLFGVR